MEQVGAAAPRTLNAGPLSRMLTNRYPTTDMTASTSTSHTRRILAIAGFAWLEARRTRLPWIVVCIGALLVGGSLFARSLAIAEGPRLQVAFLAAAVRLSAVFVVCLHVLASMLRELQDKGTDLLLSLDLPRAAYLFGKAAGYAGVATAVCLILWLPLAWSAPLGAALAWFATLVLETWVIVAAALFCAVTLNQLMPAAAFVLAFYALCRSMASILLIASASPFVGTSWVDAVLRSGIQTAYFVLPGLDRFTRTEWLTEGGPPTGALLTCGAEAMLYVGVLLSASLIDLYRKNA